MTATSHGVRMTSKDVLDAADAIRRGMIPSRTWAAIADLLDSIGDGLYEAERAGHADPATETAYGEAASAIAQAMWGEQR
jgi:hypothetical protein